jgi:predicted transcriptional regulator
MYMAFSPNNFPAAIAEIRRLSEENKQLRRQLAELQKTCGDTVKRGRPKTQDKDAQP